MGGRSLGDPTARLLGRVSLNPMVHIDPIGTILLPLLALFSGCRSLAGRSRSRSTSAGCGTRRRDFMIVAAAGPASNLLLATVAALIFHAAGAMPVGEPTSGCAMLLLAVC